MAQEETRLLSSSGEAERVTAGFRPGWRAGLSAERGCDKNDTGLEQGRGQMRARNLLGFSESFDCRVTWGLIKTHTRSG